MDEEIKVFVPVEFVGVSPAVKEKNGLLIKSLQEIEIEALPMDILHSIEVDISKFTEIDQSFYVKDLAVSKRPLTNEAPTCSRRYSSTGS